jgi:hypothetical protein
MSKQKGPLGDFSEFKGEIQQYFQCVVSDLDKMKEATDLLDKQAREMKQKRTQLEKAAIQTALYILRSAENKDDFFALSSLEWGNGYTGSQAKATAAWERWEQKLGRYILKECIGRDYLDQCSFIDDVSIAKLQEAGISK